MPFDISGLFQHFQNGESCTIVAETLQILKPVMCFYMLYILYIYAIHVIGPKQNNDHTDIKLKMETLQ